MRNCRDVATETHISFLKSLIMSCTGHEPEEGFSTMPDTTEYRAYTLDPEGDKDAST